MVLEKKKKEREKRKIPFVNPFERLKQKKVWKSESFFFLLKHFYRLYIDIV